jgi:hypothetical protein
VRAHSHNSRTDPAVATQLIVFLEKIDSSLWQGRLTYKTAKALSSPRLLFEPVKEGVDFSQMGYAFAIHAVTRHSATGDKHPFATSQAGELPGDTPVR